jgi:hypothetical protein
MSRQAFFIIEPDYTYGKYDHSRSVIQNGGTVAFNGEAKNLGQKGV